MAEVAGLLCISRQAVAQRISEGHLPGVQDSDPQLVPRDAALAAHAELLQKYESKVTALRTASRALALPEEDANAVAEQPADYQPSSPPARQALHAAERLSEALQEERRGRAVAEARIDELKGHLKRVNAAIAALIPDPDVHLDIPDRG